MLKNEPKIHTKRPIPLKWSYYIDRKQWRYFPEKRLQFLKQITFQKKKFTHTEAWKKITNSKLNCLIKAFFLLVFQKSTLPLLFIFFWSAYVILHVFVVCCDKTFRTFRFLPVLTFKILKNLKLAIYGCWDFKVCIYLWSKNKNLKKIALLTFWLFCSYCNFLFLFFIFFPIIKRLINFLLHKQKDFLKKKQLKKTKKQKYKYSKILQKKKC